LNAWNAGQYVRFGPIIRAVAANDRLFVGCPDKYEIDVYTASGQLAHRIRRPLQPMRVTQQVLDDLSRRANATSIERGEVVRAPRPAHADFFPAFDGLLADRTGNLWVQEYHWDATLPKQYAVFDTRGVWLTSVSMPPRFTPLFIDRDRVVGRWLDPDDVEYVRVYRIIKP
jgi:hypothetical protein